MSSTRLRFPNIISSVDGHIRNNIIYTVGTHLNELFFFFYFI